MSKQRQFRESRHVRIYHWLRETAAWQDLDCNARCAYLELAARYSGTDDRGFSNNGRIPMSLLEMAGALHTSKQTAMRAINSLVQHGFVVVEKKGRFTTGFRHASEYRLTEFPFSGAVASKEFAKWPNLETGSVAKPRRVSAWNRSGADVEQSQRVTAGYGSTRGPDARGAGSLAKPQVVYQGASLQTGAVKEVSIDGDAVGTSHSEKEISLSRAIARPHSAGRNSSVVRQQPFGPSQALLSSKLMQRARAERGK